MVHTTGEEGQSISQKNKNHSVNNPCLSGRIPTPGPAPPSRRPGKIVPRPWCYTIRKIFRVSQTDNNDNGIINSYGDAPSAAAPRRPPGSPGTRHPSPRSGQSIAISNNSIESFYLTTLYNLVIVKATNCLFHGCDLLGACRKTPAKQRPRGSTYTGEKSKRPRSGGKEVVIRREQRIGGKIGHPDGLFTRPPQGVVPQKAKTGAA